MKNKVLILAFIISLLALGCSKTESPILAKAGKTPVTLNDMKSVLTKDTYDVLSSGKLNSIHAQHFFSAAIDNKIMYLLAEKEGIKINEDDRYNAIKKGFNAKKRPFLLSIGISEKDINRIFREYYLQLLYAEKMRDTMQFSEDELQKYFEKNHDQYIKKPHIICNRIAVRVDDPGQSLAVFSDMQQSLRKFSNKYDMVKHSLETKFPDRITVSENVIFNELQLKLIFRKSPGEIKALFNLPVNSFSEPYEINDEVVLFNILATNKEEIEPVYEDIKDFLVKGLLDVKLSSVKAAKLDAFKAENGIEIIIEDPVSLLIEKRTDK